MSFSNRFALAGETDPAAWRGSLGLIVRTALLAYAALFLLPLEFYPSGTGIDESNCIGLNYFPNHGVVFGRDVATTYGPLGFLCCPLDMGSNLPWAIWIRLAVWIILVALLTLAVLRQRVGLFQVALLTGALVPGARLFSVGYTGFDYLIAFAVLLALILAAQPGRWYLFLLTACLLTVLLSFVKFSAALLAALSVAAFLLTQVLLDRRRGLRAAVLAALALPGVFVLAYLLYNPSLGDMVTYLRSAYEISAGFSEAMSLPGRMSEAWFAVVVLALLAGWVLRYLLAKQRCLVWCLPLLPSVYVTFRHGFQRQDGHVVIFFSSALLIFGLLFLYAEMKLLMRCMSLATMAFLWGAWAYAWHPYVGAAEQVRYITGRTAGRDLADVVTFGRTRAHLRQLSQQNLLGVRLPPSVRERIGRAAVGIFPWEVSYVAANPLTFRPFFVFQTYNAYTSYLDLKNAGQLEDPRLAPRYILMEWASVDGRHPLLDVPAMWLSLYRWYDADDRSGGLLLLRRRSTPRVTTPAPLRAVEFRIGEAVEVPLSPDLVVAKIFLRLNLWGRAYGLALRIPEVRISFSTSSGVSPSYRIVAATLVNGVPVSVVPLSLLDLDNLLRNGVAGETVLTFRIHGPGARYYGPTARVEYQTLTGSRVRVDPGARRAPKLISVLPSSGRGMKGTLRLTCSDANGADELSTVQGLINARRTGTDSCYFTYDHVGHRVSLADDNGYTWSKYVALGSPVFLENSQCVLDPARSTASSSGSVLTLDLAVSFKSSFQGDKTVYMQAIDAAGLTAGWEAMGAWAVQLDGP